MLVVNNSCHKPLANTAQVSLTSIMIEAFSIIFIFGRYLNITLRIITGCLQNFTYNTLNNSSLIQTAVPIPLLLPVPPLTPPLSPRETPLFPFRKQQASQGYKPT